MTIRELQYAIQDAIDEKGVSDNARVNVETNKDGEIVIRAVENRISNGADGKDNPYCADFFLGKV